MLPLETAADERRRDSSVALLPIGACEQHGDYLPLTTDTLIAATVAQTLGTSYSLWILPPVTITCSHEHSAWRGTVSISARTLYAIVADVQEATRAAGASHLVLINAHGGNYALSNITQELNAAYPRSVALFPQRRDWDRARRDAHLITTGHDDMHGGELEVSILLHTHPHVVRPGYETTDHEAPDRPHLLTLGMPAYTTNGIIGRPSLASATKGKDVLASLVKSFADYLNVLTEMDLASSPFHHDAKES